MIQYAVTVIKISSDAGKLSYKADDKTGHKGIPVQSEGQKNNILIQLFDNIQVYRSGMIDQIRYTHRGFPKKIP